MASAALPLAANWGALLEGDARPTFYLLAGLGAGLFFFFKGFRTWRHMRLIQDTPTSRIRSMALGRVELYGQAVEKAELTAPLTGAACVYYRYQIEEEVQGNKHRSWRTVDSGSSSAWPFYLEDDTGRVAVDPREATLELPPDYREINPDLTGALGNFLAERGVDTHSFFVFRKKLRFTEWHISPGEHVYVLGVAQERGGMVHERRVRIAEKLAALKADPEAMAHLDSDGDGSVSAEEWDVARRLIVAEVERAGFDDRVVVGKGEHSGTPFYISDRDEKAVVKEHLWKARASVFGGAVLSLFCLGGLLHRVGILWG